MDLQISGICSTSDSRVRIKPKRVTSRTNALFKSQVVCGFINCVEVRYGVSAGDTDGHAGLGK